jgi:hypothetical protein
MTIYKDNFDSNPPSVGLSPEEILAQKEMAGGLEYDDLEEASEADEVPPPVQPQPEPLQTQKPVYQEELKSTKPSSLGWKNLPVRTLPSGGLYYPEGTRLAIRSAEVKEIRHFSTIDDSDEIDIDEKLNYILEKCSFMEIPGRPNSHYDLKYEDRFFVIMAIRDLTFVQGENRIILTPKTGCDKKEECIFSNGVELRTGILSNYEIEEDIMKYYSSIERCFVFPLKKENRSIKMYIPSIGIKSKLDSFISKNRKEVEDIENILPFLFDDWKTTSEFDFRSQINASNSWSKEEFSLYFELSNRIKIGTRLNTRMSCPNCGAEVTAPISFPGGIRSLFVISDIFGELLG